MHIRKGVKLLEEREGQGDLVQRQHEYIVAIRLSLNEGEILADPPLSFRPYSGQALHDDGFFEHQTRINREWLIPGLFYAIQDMRIGGYRKVAISPHLAYGDKGRPGMIPPHATLIAEIEVLREPPGPSAERQKIEIPEGETILTQDQLCQRYQITLPTLWRWRKAGQLPMGIIMGTRVRWRLSTLAQWEADGRPRVSPSLDELSERRERVFAHLRELSSAQLDKETGPALREIDGSNNLVFNLGLELALLIDEAGQWNGPPLERLVHDDAAAAHQSHNLANVLQKILSE